MSKRRPPISSVVKAKIPRLSRVLVAVSGGRDSTVLLHAVLQVQRLLELTIEVCHINHRLRANSDDDEAFVVRWCADLGLPCHTERLPPRPEGENVEAWARTQRYKVFKRVMAERDLTVLLTAHNANDVAETLLMRLVANKELTSIEEFDSRRKVIRPLIDVSREQINEYVAHHGVPFVEDPTNRDPAFVRNRIRHEVIPVLAERFDPSIVWILSERAKSLAADSEALHEAALQVVRSVGQLQEGDAEWMARCRSTLSDTAEAVRWRVAQLLFTPLLGFTVGEARARAIVSLLEGETRILQLGNDITLKVGPGGLEVIRAAG